MNTVKVKEVIPVAIFGMGGIASVSHNWSRPWLKLQGILVMTSIESKFELARKLGCNWGLYQSKESG